MFALHKWAIDYDRLKSCFQPQSKWLLYVRSVYMKHEFDAVRQKLMPYGTTHKE
jgi:hypothetical protein